MSSEPLEERVARYQAQAWADEPSDWFGRRGLEYSTIERFRVGYTGTRERSPSGLDIRRCAVFPVEDGLGRVRNVRYRPLYEHTGAKYLSEGTSHLFAVRALDNPVVYVCEGEPDTMIAWQLGFKAVGLSGAHNFRPAWRFLFRAPHVDKVVICMDPDAAGREASVKLYGLLKEVATRLAVVDLPNNMDLNDTFLRYGAETTKEALDGAMER